jgi:hypothetical protein
VQASQDWKKIWLGAKNMRDLMTVLCAFEKRKFAKSEEESRITRNMVLRM